MATEEEPNEWNSDEVMANMKLERRTLDETHEQQVRRLLIENAPAAAHSLIHLALHANNENTRMNAAKYITDRVLDPENSDTKSKWEGIIDAVMEQAEEHANNG